MAFSWANKLPENQRYQIWESLVKSRVVYGMATVNVALIPTFVVFFIPHGALIMPESNCVNYYERLSLRSLLGQLSRG